MARTQQRGFTLIEVMIVVAIIAILAAIAIPSYADYVRRGQIQEAFTLLTNYRIKMEQYFQDNRNYGTGSCIAGGIATSWTMPDTSQKYFTISCDLSGSGYVLTATSKSTVATSHVYTLTSTTGVDAAKATTTFKGVASSATCWLSTGNEC